MSVYPPSFTEDGVWFKNLASINAFFQAGKGFDIDTENFLGATLEGHEIRGRYQRRQTLHLLYEVPWSLCTVMFVNRSIKIRSLALGARRGFILNYWRWQPGLRNLVDTINWKIYKEYLKTLLLGSKSPETPLFRFFRHALCERQVLRIVSQFAGW